MPTNTLALDEESLEFGYTLNQMILYDVFFNDVDGIEFNPDTFEDTSESAPQYDFDIIQEKLYEIYCNNNFDVDNAYATCCTQVCCLEDYTREELCDEIYRLRVENDRLYTENETLYNAATGLNKSCFDINEAWNDVYEDVLENLGSLMYYLLSQYALPIESPYEGEDIKLGKIKIPKPSIPISIPKPVIKIPTINNIKVKVRKIVPKVRLNRLRRNVSLNNIWRALGIKRQIDHLTRAEVKNLRTMDQHYKDPIITHTRITENTTFDDIQGSVLKRVEQDINFAQDIWKNIFILKNTIHQLNIDINDDEHPMIKNSMHLLNDEFVRSQLRENITNTDIVILYTGGTSLRDKITDTESRVVGNATQRKVLENGIIKEYISILICNGASNVALAHEVGHALFFTNSKGNVEDPNPYVDNSTGTPIRVPGHDNDPANLMYPILPSTPIITQTQVNKAEQSTLFTN